MADTVSVTQLKPCPNPWCEQSDPVVGERRDVWRAKRPLRVQCQCGMAGPDADTEAGAITAWNTRASTQPAPAFPREEVAAEVRALRDALLWYRDNAAMCRKIGSIGEPARKALDADGGKRADEVMDNSPVLAALLQGKQP
ncbi:Restriction alleviation protein Lar [Sphingomonas sp. OV641]|uniref:Lar family restriction alleviation protein n=1 Tax=Sphingomonas sp. OV641 TaxID=1881068 RepID=UPI0008CA4896|nr:Lar family restriction alleviation protein [Sphingomonas sp. OV641]SEJ16115.1 Restriction alleviation protein Lar [Sphingomonas sp. OV641]